MNELLFQFGATQPFFTLRPAGHFDCGRTLEYLLIQTPNFSCTEPNALIIITYFHRSEQFSPFEFSSARIKIGV